MRLETQELRVLAAVVQNSGFKRAAEELNISQSAVSQAVAGLERKLDQRLLHRTPVAPTEAGLRILTYAQHQAREETLLLGDLRDIALGQMEKLSLAVNSTINRYHAGELLEQFCQAHPYARLQIDEQPSRQIIQAVVAGNVELGMGPFQTHMPAVECLPLFDELRTLVVSRHHPLIDSLHEDAVAALQQVPLLASWLDDPQERPGNERIRDYFSRVWEVRPINLRLELLAGRRAVGYISDRVLAQEPLCEDLVEIQGLPFSRIRRSVGLFYRKDVRLSAGARKFVSLCKEHWS